MIKIVDMKKLRYLIFIIIIFTKTWNGRCWSGKLFKQKVILDLRDDYNFSITYQLYFNAISGRTNQFVLGIPKEEDIRWNLDNSYFKINNNLYPIDILKKKDDNRVVVQLKERINIRGDFFIQLNYSLPLKDLFTRETEDPVRFDWWPMVWDLSIEKVEIELYLPTRKHNKNNSKIEFLEDIEGDIEITRTEYGFRVEKIMLSRWKKIPLKFQIKKEGEKKERKRYNKVGSIFSSVFKTFDSIKQLLMNLPKPYLFLVLPLFWFFYGLLFIYLESEERGLSPLLFKQLSPPTRWGFFTLISSLGVLFQYWIDIFWGTLIFFITWLLYLVKLEFEIRYEVVKRIFYLYSTITIFSSLLIGIGGVLFSSREEILWITDMIIINFYVNINLFALLRKVNRHSGSSDCSIT